MVHYHSITGFVAGSPRGNMMLMGYLQNLMHDKI